MIKKFEDGPDERCGFCKNDMPHSQKQHAAAIARWLRQDADRQDALLRQAKRQYDNP